MRLLVGVCEGGRERGKWRTKRAGGCFDMIIMVWVIVGWGNAFYLANCCKGYQIYANSLRMSYCRSKTPEETSIDHATVTRRMCQTSGIIPRIQFAAAVSRCRANFVPNP